jgi:hypothetical protein
LPENFISQFRADASRACLFIRLRRGGRGFCFRVMDKSVTSSSMRIALKSE